MGDLQDRQGARILETRHGTIAAMPNSPPSPQAELLAAVDIGSNSFRLEIGQMIGGRYKRVHYIKETVRLGAGLDAAGMLTTEATLRGLACLRRFSAQIAQSGVRHVRAVATQTLREAQNRDAFLLQAQAALGHPIEVIAGREEARLIHVGVAHLQPSSASRLVIDIGGRSTELILARGDQPIAVESFAVGSVSLSMRCFPDGRLTAPSFRKAQVIAGAEFEEGLTVFGHEHWQEALGSSGTAGAVSEILLANGMTDGSITPLALQTLIERCIAAGHIDKINLAGLKEDRRAVIPGGLSLLYTLAVHFGIDALKPAKGALRQGVIIELHDRLQAHRMGAAASQQDARLGTVRTLQKRFGIDTAQARRVRSVALTLWRSAQLQTLPVQDEHALELGWACDLHELGMLVSHHDFHRHSAYVLSHADAPGFSQNQLRRLGDMVMGQRGGLRKIEGALVNPDDPAFAWQVLALRLAAVKCHARGSVNPKALQLRATSKGAEVVVTPAWQRAQARTNYLLEEEAALWARQGPFVVRVVATTDSADDHWV
jgi:exopolyphosphatase / guanosine-5'-triphosphate,3'-diphosphate pyrophosphatase